MSDVASRREFIVDEDTQMRAVEQTLLERFRQLDRATVCAHIERAKQQFTQARVRTFVPLLVQRTVADNLRHLYPSR